MVSAPVHANDPLDNTYGATYIGTIFCAIIYGATLLQTFNYFQRYTDPWYIKATVIVVICFDTLHLFAISSLDYHYLVTNHNNPAELTNLAWQLMFEILLLLVNITVVQAFFTYRVFKLSKSKLLTFAILFLALVQMGIGFYWLGLAWPKKIYADLLPLVHWIIINNVLVCITDILITGSLCVLLYRSRTGIRRTDTLINKLAVFVVSTGVLPTIFVTLALIFFIARPVSLISSALYYVSIHLYTNALITSLNVRSVCCREAIELSQTNIAFTPRRKTGMTTSDSRSLGILIDTKDEMSLGMVKNTGTKGPIESGDGSLPDRGGSC